MLGVGLSATHRGHYPPPNFTVIACRESVVHGCATITAWFRAPWPDSLEMMVIAHQGRDGGCGCRRGAGQSSSWYPSLPRRWRASPDQNWNCTLQPGHVAGPEGWEKYRPWVGRKRVRRLRCHCERPGVVVVTDPIRATRAVVPQDEMGRRLNVSACRTTGLCRKGRMEAFLGCEENPGMVIHGMMGEEMAVMPQSPIADGTPRN